MAGFGHARFGHGPFGRSDLGRDLVIDDFPETYFDDSLVLSSGETITENNKDPLLKYLKTVANSVNKRRAEIDLLPSLLDYETAPLSIVQLWGDMLGLGIDKNDPEFLQRTFLGNASQWLQIKSSTEGYKVRGLASGFDVEVDNFWRVNPIYESFIPLRNRYYLKPANADASAQKILHADIPPGTVVGPPSTEGPDYAKSSYLRLVFSIATPINNTLDYNTLLNLVISKIRDVVAIHHEMQSPQFLVRMNINVSSAIAMTASEKAMLPASEAYRYDITPADMIETDRVVKPTVDMSITIT